MRASTWSGIDKQIATTLDRIRQQGGAVRLLTRTITSPTASALIAAFPGSFKNARHVRYDASNTFPRREDILRMDYNLSDRTRLSSRYINNSDSQLR